MTVIARKLAVGALILGSSGLMDLTRSWAGWDANNVSAYWDGTRAGIGREGAAAMEGGIEQAQEELTPQVMSLPGVVGIAIGECEGKPCIKVLVASKTRELMGKIPPTYKGYKVTVDEVGEIRGPRPPQ